MTSLETARRAMVDRQIRPSDVTRRGVIGAMLETPREVFAPPHLAALAYAESAVALPGGRVLMEARQLAKLLDAAEIDPEDRVLVVGCATGYAAAVAARVGREVVAVESDPALAAEARLALARAGAPNVRLIEGPLEKGAPEQGPYNAIVIDGGVELEPEAIAAQLAPGGRLVYIRMEGGLGRARLIRGGLASRALFDASAPVLPGFRRVAGFVF